MRGTVAGRADGVRGDGAIHGCPTLPGPAPDVEPSTDRLTSYLRMPRLRRGEATAAGRRAITRERRGHDERTICAPVRRGVRSGVRTGAGRGGAGHGRNHPLPPAPPLTAAPGSPTCRRTGTARCCSTATATARCSPQDAPDPNTQAALLNAGYALAGSGYDPNGSLWALGSAVRDQFQTLQAVKKTVLPSRPTQVLAFGTSMGGLISALEDQQSNGRLDGALTTCGLVAGGIQLNNYQLDGEYAINKLLAGDAAKLVNYTSQGDAVTAAVDAQQRGRPGADHSRRAAPAWRWRCR